MSSKKIKNNLALKQSEKINIKFVNKDIDFLNCENEYYKCIESLLNSKVVMEMQEYMHHGETSCFEHCVNVSYANYKVCKLLKLDYKSAARAGILHDLFLYDWHKDESRNMLEKHGFTHSRIALKNAKKNFYLNDKEKDMILKHMWPLNITLPQYKESYIIAFTDKFCCIMEVVSAFNYKIKGINVKKAILKYITNN
jgi:uncharacterized protein